MDEMLENGITVDKFWSSKEALTLEKHVPEKPPLSTDSTVVHSLFKTEEIKKNKQIKDKCYRFMKKNKILFWVERIVLCSVCIAVAGGFTVPIIVYGGMNMGQGNTTKLLSDLDLDSCSSITVQVCR